MYFANLLNKVITICCEIILFIILVLMILDIILRYLFNASIPGGGELVPYLFTWLSFFGATVAVKSHEHLAVDIWSTKLSKKWKRVQSIAVNIFQAIFFIIVAYSGWIMTKHNMSQLSPYFSIPYGIVYFSVPSFGVVATIYSILTILSGGKE